MGPMRRTSYRHHHIWPMRKAKLCSEGRERLAYYTQELMNDSRFDSMVESCRYESEPNIVLSKPLEQVTIKAVPEPSQLPRRDVEDLQDLPEEIRHHLEERETEKEFARRHAEKKCDFSRCLCQRALGEEVHELHQKASKALGFIRLPCFK